LSLKVPKPNTSAILLPLYFELMANNIFSIY